MKNLKDIILKYKAWVIIFALFLLTPVSIFAIDKGYSYFQVKQIIDQAKILSAAGKYDEAVSVLSLAENKWATKALKAEVVSELERNRDLEEQAIEATKSGAIVVSPSPSPTPKIIKTEQKQNPSPIPTPSPSTLPIISYSPSPTITEKKKVPVTVRYLQNRTIYCYEDGANEVTAADSAIEMAGQGFTICSNSAQIANNGCKLACLGDLNCISACLPSYQADLDKCVQENSPDSAIQQLINVLGQYCP